jgi:transposase
MLNLETGEVEESVLSHEGTKVRQFYTALPRPVRVGIEATGSMQWFLELMDELQIECLVGHPAMIRAQERDRSLLWRQKSMLAMRAASPMAKPCLVM